jgi:2-isopropylmalate synthase
LLHTDGRVVCEPAVGDGPVDAVLKSIQRGTGVELKVADYRVRSVTGGLDAQGEALVEVEYDGRKISGRGLDTNVIAASATAFLQVINRVVARALHPRLKPTDLVPQESVPVA